MHHSQEEHLAGDDLDELTGDDDHPNTTSEEDPVTGPSEMPDAPEPEDTELGRTGRHPDGKMAPHDEGEITFAVGRKGDKVFLNFGTRVKSLGMTPEQAKALGGELLNYARDVA